MDYKEKYELALERASKIHNETEFNYEKGMMEEIFPELKESEDERIRKTLIEMFSNVGKKEWRDIPTEKIISWLEKQAERKTPQWMIDFLDNYRRKFGCSLDYDEARDVDGKILCIKEWLEKQGEQETEEKI